MRLLLARRPSESWNSCVTLVREKYATAFGADVAPNPDAFLVGYMEAAPGPSQKAAACAGLTFGSERPFFSERYLDEKIENVIARRFGSAPERSRIIEVGSLAGGVGRSGHELIRVTPLIAWCLGMQYILCTATAQLSVIFRKLSIPFTPFIPAERSRLDASEQSRWGGYYDSKPWTGAIPLRDAVPMFADLTGRYSFTDPEVTLLAGDRQPEHSSPGVNHAGY